MPASRAISNASPRVIPPRQYLPLDVQTSPLRTMKKCVELQVATKPCGSSISASSAPACVACTDARIQLSFECELIFWSCTAGFPPAHVNREELETALVNGRVRLFVFSDDDDRCRCHND